MAFLSGTKKSPTTDTGTASPHLAQVSVQAVQVLDMVPINEMCRIPHQSVHYVAIWIQGIQNGKHSLQTSQRSTLADHGCS